VIQGEEKDYQLSQEQIDACLIDFMERSDNLSKNQSQTEDNKKKNRSLKKMSNEISLVFQKKNTK